ncbi:entericidin A/B family lipoprotein [Lacimonas salitolerans]|uniref:Entericidin A/B family lipoprotein n=1 Tax=Lacimonas salitolerans TaxID=1323750 RepID=A0ABW4ENX4_9RHOB
MRRTRNSIISLLALGFLAACETVDGAGEDIQSTGQAISEASQDAQD